MNDIASARQIRPEDGTGWSPILDGDVAERALETVSAIVGDVRAIIGRVGIRTATDSTTSLAPEPLLACDGACLAVFCAYLAGAELRDEAELAGQLLDRAVETIASTSTTPALYGGFTGVAWAAAHLEGRLFPPSDDDPNEDIDAALLDYLAPSPWRDDYDLISGLVGIGVYALERQPRPSAVEILTRVLHRLTETAERNASGATWFTQAELLPASHRQTSPRGFYNLGVAHGVPGVIALLGGACAAGIETRESRSLLDEAVGWLLAQKLHPDSASTFSTWIEPGVVPEPSRSAWCYGDPGIAAALFSAGHAVGNPDWQREALVIARRAAGRSAEEAGVRDAGLCHGAAGLGHLFNRMFQATGDATLREAARFWLLRALDMREPNGGVAGYRPYRGTDRAGERHQDVSILEGAPGIALALLAAIGPIEPEWDRTMLLSLRAAGRAVPA